MKRFSALLLFYFAIFYAAIAGQDQPASELVEIIKGYDSNKDSNLEKGLPIRYATLFTTVGAEKEAEKILDYMRKHNINYAEKVCQTLYYDFQFYKAAAKFLESEYEYSPSEEIAELYFRNDSPHLNPQVVLKILNDDYVPSHILSYIFNTHDRKLRSACVKAISNSKKLNAAARTVLLADMILGWNYAGGKGFDLKRAEGLLNCSGKEKILANLPNSNDIEILDFYFKHGRYSDLFSNVGELKIPPDSNSDFAKICRAMQNLDFSKESENLYKKYYAKNFTCGVFYYHCLKTRNAPEAAEVLKQIKETSYRSIDYGALLNKETIESLLEAILNKSYGNHVFYSLETQCKSRGLDDLVFRFLKDNNLIGTYTGSAEFAISYFCKKGKKYYKDAFDLCEKSYKAGKRSPGIIRAYCVMLIKGIGTPPNPKLAIEIIKENPYEDSAAPLLYYCCKYGAGCEKDAVKAGEYMNRIKADYSAKICAMEIFGGESNIWYPFTLDIPYEKILFLLPDHIHLAEQMVKEKRISEQLVLDIFEKEPLSDKDRLALIDFALDSFASGGFNDFKILQAMLDSAKGAIERIGKDERIDGMQRKICCAKLRKAKSDGKKYFEILSEHKKDVDFESDVEKDPVFAEALAFCFDNGYGCEPDKKRAESIRTKIKEYSKNKDKDYCAIRVILNHYFGITKNSYIKFSIPAAEYWLDFFLETNPQFFAYNYAYMNARRKADFEKFIEYYKKYLSEKEKQPTKTKFGNLPKLIFQSLGKVFGENPNLLSDLEKLAQSDCTALEWISYMYKQGISVGKDQGKSEEYLNKYASRAKWPQTSAYKYIRGEYGFKDIERAKEIYDLCIKSGKISKTKYPSFEKFVEFVNSNKSIFY